MNKIVSKFFILVVLSGLILAILPVLGRSFEFGNTIFWHIRFPRVLTCWLVGGGLSVGGLIYQAIFRNDLATPHILGITSGASLGTAITIFFGLTGHTFGYWDFKTLMAFLGGLGSSVLIYIMAEYWKNFRIENLLLTGVAISMICSSFVLLIQFLDHERTTSQIIYWLVGGVDVVGMETPLSLAPLVFLSLLILFFYSGELNLLSVGKIFSQSRGVDFEKKIKVILIVISFLIASIVAECGPIGFIGLIIPHIVKGILGRDHRFLIGACFMVGGAFLGCCDLVARTFFQYSVIPVGVITAFLGGLFFLWVLIKKANRR